MTKQKPDNSERKKTITALEEESILQFWEEEQIFQKSIDNRDGSDEFIFYDGPPFATGTPHYGHLLPGTIKDVIPRFQTMRGMKVERKWGWDCHGLPVENIVEPSLGLNSRKEIIDYGIDKFNKTAAETVMQYKSDWEEIIPRTGRWVDMVDHYKTMDTSYTESVWWAFKRLQQKDLVYKGFKAMQICPRCETTLSNNEVAEGYKDIKDLSVTAKFEIVSEPGTYLLAWTTTPWTLPGNVAIAVNNEIDYVKVKTESGQFVVAKSLIDDVFAHAQITDYEIVGEMKGSELVGLEYIPPFDYYKNNTSIKNHENGWHVYHADFVTDDAGTGIAHEAPAFGAEDMELGEQHNLPFVQHVGMDGHFKPEVADFAGMQVKNKDNHMSTDIEIIKWLAHNNFLFSKEKIEHSYPHCWRCKTPLLNYAADSWFIKTTALREKMLSENESVSWTPAHIGKKRFHNWIENNIDWAVSRSRFWGAPLPVWESPSGKQEFIGSIEELKSKTRSSNNIFVIRHGQSVSNERGTVSSTPNTEIDTLTETGKQQVLDSVSQFSHLFEEAIDKRTGVDVIITSPFGRTTETAKILAEQFGLSQDDIVLDDRLVERNFGQFDGKQYDEYFQYLEKNDTGELSLKLPEGESALDVKDRMMDFYYDIDKQYKGKNILVVTHFTPYWLSFAGSRGMNNGQAYDLREHWGTVHNAKPRLLDFAPFPHDSHYVMNLHRPYVDAVTFKQDGEEYKIVGDVFDCWVESGSMPFASLQFKGEADQPDRYPAAFISEGLDQTRGWFYSLMALGVGLFDQSPYQNVIVHGMVLAEDGKKMSKSLKNYPPITDVLDTYGADALRFFLVNSPAMRGDPVLLSEKGIDEVVKKIVIRSKNILSFYTMYKQDNAQVDHSLSPNALDIWIKSRLAETHRAVTSGLETYQLDKSCAPINSFVDDFSTWYVRRSRDRYKGSDIEDRNFALATTKYVLREFAKLAAPFMPFLAEQLWQELKTDTDKESVHLEDWSAEMEVDQNVLANMQAVRDLVSIALELRSSNKLKVRQPLASITISNKEIAESEQLKTIMAEELNVKTVLFDDSQEPEVVLDTNLNPELEQEGLYRELLRAVQSERKKQKMNPSDMVTLTIDGDVAVLDAVKQFEIDMKSVAGISEIVMAENKSETVMLNGKEAQFTIAKN